MVPKSTGTTRERLSRDTVVDGAITLADREGLDALTIRRLAQEHGVTPMALYWHFHEKEDLLDAVAERLLNGVRLPEPTDAPWAEQLRAILVAYLDAMRPHPVLAGLALPRVLKSEPGLRLADRVLGLLAAAGFGTEEASQTGSFLLSAMSTLITAEPGPHKALRGEERDAAVRAKRASLGALSPARFPHVIAAADALSDCPDDDVYYARGVELLVRGAQNLRPA